ncbi:substrate-binding domain-containing protein [soil metagenome]
MKTITKVLMGVVAISAVGCGNGGSTTASTSGETAPASVDATKKLEIAVIPKGATHEYWKSIHEGADKAAAELGNVDIIWQGPMKEDDRDGQIKVVEDFISKGVNGIVLAPLDDVALANPVKDAQNANIPVVIIDSGLKNVEPVSYVATDNYKGGSMAADEMVKVLGGKGDIVVLRYQVGSASTMDREQGFLDEIKKTPAIHVLSDNQYAGATVETAQKTSENMLQPFRNADGSLKIQGIYAPNESSTFGMLRTLQDNNWAGKVKFIGFDTSAKLLEALTKGEINGLIVQNPRNMGYLGVKTLVEKIRGGKVEAKIDTGATLVTKDNMNEDSMKELLAPPKN